MQLWVTYIILDASFMHLSGSTCVSYHPGNTADVLDELLTSARADESNLRQTFVVTYHSNFSIL